LKNSASHQGNRTSKKEPSSKLARRRQTSGIVSETLANSASYQGKFTLKKEPSSKLARRRQLSSQDVIGKYPAEVAFFSFLYSELQESILFFERTQEEHCIRVARLHEGSDILLRHGSNLMEDRWSALARSAFKVFSDLLLLEQYAITTFCAFSKILKKHDKRTGRNTRNAFMAMVSKANFNDTSRLQQMIRITQERYDEASERLIQPGRPKLREDERLFLDMVSQLNGDIEVAPGARVLQNACKQPRQGGTSKQQSSSARDSQITRQLSGKGERERKETEGKRCKQTLSS
jgi:hypothetical protein